MESLQNKISELEDGVNRHQFEASEHKVHNNLYIPLICSNEVVVCLQVKELEQKLELERSGARRHESQITRLRHQLERMQDEKTEDVSYKNNESLSRAQKQIRELRSEVQEAERKEQDMAKKRRNAVRNSDLILL